MSEGDSTSLVEANDTLAQRQNSADMDRESPKNDGEPPKKRRRTAKPNGEKKFECKHEGCGKTYSRAEHLYRHQLNHSPKQIYRCDFPDCNRYFVRQDLCVRHRERHTTSGSQLHKRDSFVQNGPQHEDDGIQDTAKSHAVSGADKDSGEAADVHDEIGAMQSAVHRSRLPSGAISPTANTVGFNCSNQRNDFSRPGLPARRTGSFVKSPVTIDSSGGVVGWQSTNTNELHDTSNDQTLQSYYPHDVSERPMPSPSRSYSDASTTPNHFRGFRASGDNFLNNAGRSSYEMTDTISPNINVANIFRGSDVQHQPVDAFAAAISQGLSSNQADPFAFSAMNPNMASLDANSMYGYPIFGGDDFNRSPFALADDFTAWLFNDGSNGTTDMSPNQLLAAYGDNSNAFIQGPSFSKSPTAGSLGHHQDSMSTNPMNLTNLVDKSMSSYIMSDEKRQELLHIMQNQFVERPHDAVKKRKDSVFEGHIDADGHILSLRMMHTYIGSYWYHQHAQLPILHKPTFSADKTESLLLLAVIAIGAATLDKAYGTGLTDSAAEFANFLAWHLRWEIVRDADFRPPAKLWVFQTLLLIEVYEKMYSTRILHERAHIHHDSTLTLMRRGSSLIGRSASETPPSGPEDVQKASDAHEASSSKSEEAWARWVTAESTRRVAFAAFVIDSIHCTMFGHSAKMVAHEMRLPLPCDEGLWSATSPAEVGRVQSSLQTNGIKPTMFLDGLKKTLNGQRVRTNSFGRTILMSGLLSVSWHMTQRDLQISSLGPRTASSFGDGKNWKGVLLRAFDNWKRDFDEALAESTTTPPSPARPGTGPSVHSLIRPIDDENIFESRTVLHHLAHIAAHVDIVDCQVFAGASRLLSRAVTPKDFSAVREKIEKWATKASARDSAFYALKFIAQVLIPPDPVSPSTLSTPTLATTTNPLDSMNPYHRPHHASPILPQAFERNQYIARDDFLLNRPWVLYISALVVWCYGYALEGPILPRPLDSDFATYEQREADMKLFLDRVASVRAPDDLESVQGKNRCLGLLLILKDSFASTRWELTHEAAGLLGNAAMKLKGEVGGHFRGAGGVMNGFNSKKRGGGGLGPATDAFGGGLGVTSTGGRVRPTPSSATVGAGGYTSSSHRATNITADMR